MSHTWAMRRNQATIYSVDYWTPHHDKCVRCWFWIHIHTRQKRFPDPKSNSRLTSINWMFSCFSNICSQSPHWGSCFSANLTTFRLILSTLIFWCFLYLLQFVVLIAFNLACPAIFHCMLPGWDICQFWLSFL